MNSNNHVYGNIGQFNVCWFAHKPYQMDGMIMSIILASAME